jgi:conjugative transfer region protein TrbK
MGRAAKIAGGAVLGGLLMTLALVSVTSPRRPGAFALHKGGADAPSNYQVVPGRCRTATASDPECEAAWEAGRLRFFRQQDEKK